MSDIPKADDCLELAYQLRSTQEEYDNLALKLERYVEAYGTLRAELESCRAILKEAKGCLTESNCHGNYTDLINKIKAEIET